LKYKRVLLKISGEALKGDRESGLDYEAAGNLALEISKLYNTGIEIGVVLGGGNIFRGGSAKKSFERTPADQIGMLATLMNGIALQQAIKQVGIDARLITALECPKVAESYNWEKSMRHLSMGRILIFVGGTGHPYFTTDTCAALRASEIHADVLLKCTTHVDGIYSKDPRKFTDAQKYEKVSYRKMLDEKLGILDLTAVTLCMENKIPIRICNLYAGTFIEALEGKFGSIVMEEG